MPAHAAVSKHSPMNHFAFQSVQTLRLQITSEDKPRIEVKDDVLYLSAQRDGETVIISVPADALLPITSKVARTEVKISAEGTGKKIGSRGLHYSVGSANKMAKLTEQNVKDIRELLADEAFVAGYKSINKMYTDLANTYNVSTWAIQNIAHKISWKHVTV